MSAISTAEPRCKYCNSTDVVKAGKRRLKCGIKQLYKCNGCLRKFSNLHRNQKQTDPEVILKTLILVCRGYSYEQASRFVLRKYQTLISTSVISKWVKEYNPPYLRRMLKGETAHESHEWARIKKGSIREDSCRFVGKKNYPPEQTVISHVFTHRDLNYNFQIQRPKLDRVPLPKLKEYLLRLPQIIRHEDFETAARCSQLKTDLDIAVKQSKHTQACKDALKAMQFAKTNRQRHDVVENFMLNCDTYTIAAEVPVWIDLNVPQASRLPCSSVPQASRLPLANRPDRDKAGGTPAIQGAPGGRALPNNSEQITDNPELCSVAGHIDLLQYKFNTLYILDFKPNAAKEQKRKVATQLNLYALALAERGHLLLSEMRCAWFDEEDFFSFQPQLFF